MIIYSYSIILEIIIPGINSNQLAVHIVIVLPPLGHQPPRKGKTSVSVPKGSPNANHPLIILSLLVNFLSIESEYLYTAGVYIILFRQLSTLSQCL